MGNYLDAGSGQVNHCAALKKKLCRSRDLSLKISNDVPTVWINFLGVAECKRDRNIPC